MQVVDRRQFIIMERPYERDDFRYITLANGMILSYHEDLHVQSNHELGIHLLGWAFSANDSEIRLDNHCLENKKYWSGRWILIIKDTIYLDCCGTLGCFYYCEENQAIISSSLHLIKETSKTEHIDYYHVEYGDGHGTFDYYPAPYTILTNVYKLFPSQKLVFTNNKIEIKVNDTFLQKRVLHCSEKEVADRFIEAMTCVLRNISHCYSDNVWLTLTGGVDSRTNLAIAEYAGINYRTYTVKRCNTDENDLIIPQKICSVLHRENLYLSDEIQEIAECEQLYLEHTLGCSVGTEKKQFLARKDVPNAINSIVLWGTVWESYLKYYYQYFSVGESLDDRMININEVCDRIIEKSIIHKKSLASWLTFVEGNPIDGLDWRERLYFEQRVGGWGSYSAQGIDLYDSVRIAPVNCQTLIELLLSLDVKPGDKSIQKEIVDICCPSLSKIPYGEPDGFLYRVKRKVKRVINTIGKN